MRGMKRGVLLLVVLAGLVPAGSASAQYFGQNKVQYRHYGWSSITSDHFEVYFCPGLDSLAMRVLDLAEKTDAMLSRRMGHALGRRVPLILYGSHNDFSQTNVTPELIDAGTGGFTEALRNRVVLPFTGSYEDLRHVLVHELTHAFMFDMLYGGSAAALIARQSFFSVPLWFAEGMAEYFSLGMEPNAEMFLRDGIIEGYLPPLKYSGGYLVYKQGQSAISFLVDRHGEERLRDVLRRIRQSRNFERAFQRGVGMPVEKFDEQWRAWLRKEYWPTVATKEDPEQFGRRLTDHRHDESNLNTAPAVSPQGDRIAYFSDRRQYTDVYVMSALDGKVLRRVVRGERNAQFEAIPSFRSSLTWSPDGRRLALTAKSAGRDVLYIVDPQKGKALKRFELPCDALYYPAWSPVGDSIVVAGVKDGRSDLWLVHAADGATRRLTDDSYDEKEPTWTPDGRRITFASDRLAPVVLQPLRHEKAYGSYGIFDLDLAGGLVTRVLDTFGDDHAPAWSPDGRRLAFISDRGGAPNIFLYDREDSTFTQLTDVMGGIQSLSWSRQNDRLVFSAFNLGGFDVFAVKEPLSSDGVLARLRRQSPHAVLDPSQALAAGGDSARASLRLGALSPSWPDSATGRTDSLTAGVGEPEPRLTLGGHADTLRADLPGRDEPPPWGGSDLRHPPALRDSTPALVVTTPLVERGGPFALPDSVLGQKPTPYRVRLAPDYAGGGFYASAGFGFVGSTQFLFSDFLGDHSLYVATDVFSNSLEETNALAFYNYLPRRWDFGVGLFHFKNYFSSGVTTLGEQLGGSRLFSERNFGLLLSAAYPFDRFRRAEFNYTQMFVERKFFDPVDFFETGREFRSVSSPSVSVVGDNALFGYYGPVNGQRYNLTFSPSLGWLDHGLAYRTLTFDGRRYWDLTHGYTFAGRVLAGASGGPDAQVFRVGGFSTLRGFRDFDLLGTRVALVNTELRFPFIQQLGLVGPVPIGVFNLRGAVFADAGAIWSKGDRLALTEVVGGKRRLFSERGPNGHFNGVTLGVGTGIRTAVYFLILKLDVAWNTDLVQVSRPRWYFSLGPEF
jgi:Tol biopolymer transport system component